MEKTFYWKEYLCVRIKEGEYTPGFMKTIAFGACLWKSLFVTIVIVGQTFLEQTNTKSTKKPEKKLHENLGKKDSWFMRKIGV